MKQINITKSGVLTNQASFETQEELDAFLAKHIGMGSFGSPRFSMQPVEISPAVIDSQEVLDEEGKSFDPPQFQDIEIQAAVFEDQLVESDPAGYEVSIEDISAKLEQEKVNAEAQAFLNSTDYKILRHLRQKALSQELSLSESEYLALEQQRSEAAARIVK
jgi:hypothetical protein